MKESIITGNQIVAARALTQISQAKLAARAQIDQTVLMELEAGRNFADVPATLLFRVRKALEEFGAVFIPERQGAGAGVRLKFGRGQARAIGRWEDEGGTLAEDEVP